MISIIGIINKTVLCAVRCDCGVRKIIKAKSVGILKSCGCTSKK